MINERKAKWYCSEDISLIQNYSEAIADQSQTWHCHHRAEILPCGRYSQAQLKNHGLFKHVPASQLIFLTKSEHKRLHNEGKPSGMKGKHLSDQAKAKISAALKGKTTWMKGKHHSEQTKSKMSKSRKGKNHPLFGKHHSKAAKAKIAEAIKKHWQKRRSANGRV